MDLSIIIVNYNVRHFLEQTLLSVQKAIQQMKVEIFVVDNHSVDGSLEMVQERFPWVTLIANQVNVGFAKANNQAIHKAAGRYILLLNPDTLVEEDTFVKCINFMDAHPKAGALGVKMIDGSGQFLPESKRGFPSPLVAFYKTFGLSRFFPASKRFNYYHLGHLDKDENHEIDVLSGAYMWMRKSVLDEVGLLDEDYFMYGEDIDLSYRIQKAGYKNYYIADTQIIHYKGESTKKGTLNYVRTFYLAMIIFARKHIQPGKARVFIFLLRAAIYFRAALTLANQGFRRFALPLFDAFILAFGLIWLKNIYARQFFNNPDYYQESYLYVNVPLYVGMWVLSIFFSGGYDPPWKLRRLFRGLFVGTLCIAAVYGFLNAPYRSSRALIVLGLVWAMFVLPLVRGLFQFMLYRSFTWRKDAQKNTIIVGSNSEVQRVLGLLRQSRILSNFIGAVSPNDKYDQKEVLNSVGRLDEVVQIYRINEIIFCSKDIQAGQILNWMSRLGPAYSYKIVPEKSMSIIGSHSKNSPGELYIVELSFNISSPGNRRNKRLFNLLVCLLTIPLFPASILLFKKPAQFLKNWIGVLQAKWNWVGYFPLPDEKVKLPPIKPGIIHPSTVYEDFQTDRATRSRLNFLYARDYTPWEDITIISKSWRYLDTKPN